MSVSLLASQVPPPVPFIAPLYPSTAFDTGIPATLEGFGSGMDSVGTSLALNQLSIAAEMGFRFGGGCYGIAYGLGLTDPTGAFVTVGQGMGRMDGLVCQSDVDGNPTDITYGITLSVARFWWFNKDGTAEPTSTTTAPTATSIYIGKVTADGSGITNIDTSGVVYIIDGEAWRWTADLQEPSDSPNSLIRIYTVTLGGTYFWNGTAWLLIPGISKVAHWRKQTLTYTDFQIAATSKSVNLWNLPAGLVVHAAKIVVGTAFSGGAIATMAFNLGKTGTTNAYINAQNGGATGHGTPMGTPVFESETSATQTLIEAVSTGANLSALTQGSLVAHIFASSS